MKRFWYLVLLVAGACSTQSSKDKFLQEAFNRKHGNEQTEVKDFIIRKENTVDEVTTLIYTVTLTEGDREFQVKDTLLYTVTGDGIYLDQ